MGNVPARAALRQRPGSGGRRGAAVLVVLVALCPTQSTATVAAETAAPGVGIRLDPPPVGLQTGLLRVNASVHGEAVAKVVFSLDGRPRMSKRSAPYSVELDLGRAPQPHTVGAVALSAEGVELARDEILVNAGPHRFGVRLLQPRAGRELDGSVPVEAEVELPAGELFDRLEIYLDGDLVSTQRQTSFAGTLPTSPQTPPAFVRAVAYLADGYSTEDLVFVNAPDYLDSLEVDLVEIFATIQARNGEGVAELAREDLTVIEDGTAQTIQRLEPVRDLSIHAGVLLDTSTSMSEELEVARLAALRFFETILTPRDRAAVFTFADEASLLVPFTSDADQLAAGLDGLTVEGDTALWDSLLDALYYFGGLHGRRVLVLLSDGADSGSEYTLDEALDYARRSGVAIYTIGLRVPLAASPARLALERLASETGGLSFFVDAAVELDRVYREIGREVRQQYLIAYQSTNAGREGFRSLEVRSRDRSLKVRTIRGYFP